MESGDGTVIDPTDFDKTQAGFDVRHATENNTVGLSYHYTKTTDSGTPALPMDIEYIESSRINIDGDFQLGQWQGEWSVGYLDADHGMTNFLMRAHDPMKKRRNTALADTTDFKFVLNREFSFGELSFGVDGYLATHDSVITNPTNAMFEVVNFNNVQDDRFGFFTEWQNQYGQTTVQFGVRVKHAISNADEVSGNMAMNMSDMTQAWVTWTQAWVTWTQAWVTWTQAWVAWTQAWVTWTQAWVTWIQAWVAWTQAWVT